MKQREIHTRSYKGTTRHYLTEIDFYEEDEFEVFRNGYYMLTSLVKVDDNMNVIEKSEKYTIDDLVIAIDKPTKKSLEVALKSAENYVDEAIELVDMIVDEDEGKEVTPGDVLNSMFTFTVSDGKPVAKENQVTPLEKCKYYVKHDPIEWKDIAGLREVKRELLECAELYKNREKYEEMGVTSKLNNILLSGESGTGKTYVTKALATYLGKRLFVLSGTPSEKYVGMAKKNIEQIFREAEQHSGIILFDEAECLARARSGSEENSEGESGTATLLSCMDGAKELNVIVVMATNLPDVIDDAVLTRMSKKIHISLPDFQTRKELLEMTAKKMKVSNDVDFEKIARNLSGINSRTISVILNTAGIIAVRKGLKEITQVEIEESIEKEIAGLKSETKRLCEKEKICVATHEIGHALVGYLLKDEKIQKISILPRTSDILGYVTYANEDENDRYLYTKQEYINGIMTTLAGLASEEVILSDVTGGCHNDLERATHTIEYMITKMGMSKELGLVSVSNNDLFLREKIFNETKKILDVCYDRTKEIIKENKHIIEPMVKILVEKEELTFEEFEKIFNELTKTCCNVG